MSNIIDKLIFFIIDVIGYISDILSDPVETVMKLIGCLLFAFFIYTSYIILIVSPKQEKVFNEKNSLQTQYTEQYIKDNPDMISIINTYNDCEFARLKDKKSVVEGCLKFITTDKPTQEKLSLYLSGKDKIANDVFINKNEKRN